jgi:hypothetical protein
MNPNLLICEQCGRFHWRNSRCQCNPQLLDTFTADLLASTIEAEIDACEADWNSDTYYEERTRFAERFNEL